MRDSIGREMTPRAEQRVKELGLMLRMRRWRGRIYRAAAFLLATVVVWAVVYLGILEAFNWFSR